MNTYGKFAQNAWKTLAPSQYESIVDPEMWFTNLGIEAENSVDSLQVQIAGHDTPGETYLEKVGRLTGAKMQAEEIVRSEMLTPQPEDLEEEQDENEEEDSTAIHLDFRKEMNRIMQAGMEDLNREEMERGLNP
ncbi:TnpV protein [Arthrobacter sp. AQ5-05]|uniref:TnpV protein n=1 Tax=Arthrobacter sp. AQ5-05 TaxID=2184581 RepID=UPI000DCE7198|nr:TnpV protein [Arthrobacter sp. AQ5-05]RAX47321.1 TnpV protein [Arthrobacter sp. AQ5-05]